MSLARHPKVTRFAPSLTGHLHLGHVLHLLYLKGLQKNLGLKIILRFEDHDKSRDRPEYAQSILEDLEWLGLGPMDIPSDSQGDHYRQSFFNSKYERYLQLLKSRIFYCDCSRSKLEDYWQTHPRCAGKYPGTCFERVCLQSGMNTKMKAKMKVADCEEHFFDWQRQINGSCKVDVGAVTIKDQQNQWSYQFSVVVDDLTHGVDFVVRGRDLQDTTGLYVHLWKQLTDSPPPIFYHHDLMLGANGKKLSKRAKDESIGALRSLGWSPQRVFGQILISVGLWKEKEQGVELDKALKILSY